MGCQIEANGKLQNTYWAFTWGRLFKDNDSWKAILGKHVNFMDTNKSSLSDFMNTADDLLSGKKLSKADTIVFEEEKAFFIDKLKVLAKNNYENIGKQKAEVLPGNFLKQEMGHSNIKHLDIEKLAELSDNIFKMLKKGDYDPNRIFSNLNPGTHFKKIGNTFNGSLEFEMIEKYGVSSKIKLKEAIKKDALNYMSPKQSERFAKDMLGDALGTGKVYKSMMSLRGIYRTLKYTVGFVGGGVLLANSALLGTVMYFSKRRGLESLMSSKYLNELLDQEDKGLRRLASENRAEAISLKQHSIDGNTTYNTIMDAFVEHLPLKEHGKQISEAVLKGGIHSLRDIAAASSVRKLSLAQALSKHGIDSTNIETFVKLVKSGEGGDEMLKKIDLIKADAQLFNTDFFTSAGLTGLNRNRFNRGKFQMFNTLQSYVINRSDEVRGATRKLGVAIKDGEIKNRGEFIEHIHGPNQEMKGLLNNILMSAKMSYYADAIANDKEDNKGNFIRYMVDTSDYLSALPATFYMRILTAPVKGIKSYYDYTSTTGEPEEILEGISVATLKTISETMRSFFREGAVLKAAAESIAAYGKTGQVDYAGDVLGTNLNKIMSGLGRFMLIPGLEAYDLKGIPQQDDLYGQVILAYNETNESMRKAYDLRNMADVDTMLNNKSGFRWKMARYLPVVGDIMSSSANKGGFSFTEAKYNTFKHMVENDPVMVKLRDGEMSEEILSDNSVVKRLLGDLTSFNYPRLHYKGNGKHEFTYGKGDMKEEVFVKNMAEKLGMTPEAFDAYLVGSSGGNENKLGLVKVLAAADAGEPGSSKIILSYLANKDAYNRGAYKTGIGEQAKADISREVIKEWYPYLYFADKTSWYKLGQEYMKQKEPEIFENIQKDDEFNGFLNSLAFTDLLMWSQMKDGDIDSTYIKNIFNAIPKYVKSDGGRLAIANHTLDTIASLDSATASQKQAMRVGVLAGNIDIYDEIKKDEINELLNKKELDKFENIVWGTMDNLNQVGGDWAIKDMSSGGKKQYYGGKGKERSPEKYSSGNAKTLGGLKDKFNKVFNPTRNSPKQSSPRTLANYSNKRPLAPKEYKLYVKIYQEIYKAITESLVKTKGRKYPAQFLSDLKREGRRFAVKTIKKAEDIKFKKARRRRVNTSVTAGLPGG